MERCDVFQLENALLAEFEQPCTPFVGEGAAGRVATLKSVAKIMLFPYLRFGGIARPKIYAACAPTIDTACAWGGCCYVGALCYTSP